MILLGIFLYCWIWGLFAGMVTYGMVYDGHKEPKWVILVVCTMVWAFWPLVLVLMFVGAVIRAIRDRKDGPVQEDVLSVSEEEAKNAKEMFETLMAEVENEKKDGYH